MNKGTKMILAGAGLAVGSSIMTGAARSAEDERAKFGLSCGVVAADVIGLSLLYQGFADWTAETVISKMKEEEKKETK